MHGLHLTADLYQCRCEPAWLTDAQRLGEWCVGAVAAAGLEPVGRLFHGFEAGGVAGTVLLDGSHLSLRTWPQQRAVAIDVSVSHLGGDRSVPARALMLALVERFQPEWTEQRSMDRGDGE